MSCSSYIKIILFLKQTLLIVLLLYIDYGLTLHWVLRKLLSAFITRHQYLMYNRFCAKASYIDIVFFTRLHLPNNFFIS